MIAEEPAGVPTSTHHFPEKRHLGGWVLGSGPMPGMMGPRGEPATWNQKNGSQIPASVNSGKLLTQSELQFLYRLVGTEGPALLASCCGIRRLPGKGDSSQHQGAPSGPWLRASLQHCKPPILALWLPGSHRAPRLRVLWPHQVGLSCSVQRKSEIGGADLPPPP